MTQLWVGNTSIWESEEHLMSTIKQLTGISAKSCWFVRNRSTGQYEGYGFLEFSSAKEAAEVLRLLKDTLIQDKPGHRFKLGWGSSRTNTDPDVAAQAEGYSCYVGNIPPNVDDVTLLNFFRTVVPGVINARLMMDSSGISRGYGFVKFGSSQEVLKAIDQLNGSTYFGRPLRVSDAKYNRMQSNDQNPDSNNLTLLVTNFDPKVVKEETLLRHFSAYGNVLKVKMDPIKADSAFVKMETHLAAETAKNSLQNAHFGGATACTILWGRNIEDSINEKIQTITMPEMKTPKKNRKLHAEFYDEAGIQRVLNVIQRQAEINRETPLRYLNTRIANREEVIQQLSQTQSVSSNTIVNRFWHF